MIPKHTQRSWKKIWADMAVSRHAGYSVISFCLYPPHAVSPSAYSTDSRSGASRRSAQAKAAENSNVRKKKAGSENPIG